MCESLGKALKKHSFCIHMQLTFLSCLPVLVCAFLLHQHHRRSSIRRGTGDGREAAAGSTQVEEGDKNQVPHCTSPPQTTTHTISLLELQLLKPPRANGQPAWISNPNIAGEKGTEDMTQTHTQYVTRTSQGEEERISPPQTRTQCVARIVQVREEERIRYTYTRTISTGSTNMQANKEERVRRTQYVVRGYRY